MKFSFVPQTFIGFFFFFRIRIALWNSLEKVILYILKIPTKFGVVPQSFCQNQNSVQDQDRDYDFTLNFNTRPTFYTYSRRHSPNFVWIRSFLRKLLCPQQKSTYRRTDGILFFGLFCLLRHTKHEHSSKGENFFFHSFDYNTFFFYIFRMWWESKNRCENLIILKTYDLKLLLRRFFTLLNFHALL